jgi:hypothetical protein
MTKHQQQVCAYAKQFLATNPSDPDIQGWAARSISAAIRSALRRKDQQEMLGLACFLGIDSHPDFIV